MRYAPRPTKLTDTTVRLRMMMLAGDCPVATITVAVAASIPPSRKNCQGWRNGSLSSVKISEFVVKARGHLGIFGAGRDAGKRRTPRPAHRQVGDGQEAGDTDHDRHRPDDATGSAIGRLAEHLVAAELRHVVLKNLLFGLAVLQHGVDFGA